MVVLEKTLENLLNSKIIKPVIPKGNQPWIFIGRTDAETEAPILWPPDVKNWLIGKDPDAGKDRRQEDKGMTEDQKVGWHHWLNGHEFEQAPGDGVLESMGSQRAGHNNNYVWPHKTTALCSIYTSASEGECALHWEQTVLWTARPTSVWCLADIRGTTEKCTKGGAPSGVRVRAEIQAHRFLTICRTLSQGYQGSALTFKRSDGNRKLNLYVENRFKKNSKEWSKFLRWLPEVYAFEFI